MNLYISMKKLAEKIFLLMNRMQDSSVVERWTDKREVQIQYFIGPSGGLALP